MPISEFSSWTFCKYSCCRAFQNLSMVKNHEENCQRQNADRNISGTGSGRDSGSSNNVNRLLKNLKIVLERTDSGKLLARKHEDKIQRNLPEDVRVPLKDFKIILKRTVPVPAKRLQRHHVDKSTGDSVINVDLALKDLRIILRRCDIIRLSKEQGYEAKRYRTRRPCAEASLKRMSQMTLAVGHRVTNDVLGIESDGEDYNSLTETESDSEPEPESSRSRRLKNTKSRVIGQCKYCDLKFPTSYELGNHTRLNHPRKKRFSCDHEGCTSKFTCKYAMLKHKIMHSGTKPFTCPDCLRAFFDASSFRRHKRTHTKEIRFTCKVCHKQFREPNTGRKHMMIHSGEKNHKCRYCDKLFTFPYARTLHEKRVHSPDEFGRKIRTFTCTDCKVEFRSNFHLKNHICNSTTKIIEPEIAIPEIITSDDLEFDPFAETEIDMSSDNLTVIVEGSSNKTEELPSSNVPPSPKNGLVHVNLQDIIRAKHTGIVYNDNDAEVDIKYGASLDALPADTIHIQLDSEANHGSDIWPEESNSRLRSTHDSDFRQMESNHILAPKTYAKVVHSFDNRQEEPSRIPTEKKPALAMKAENTLDLIQKFSLGVDTERALANTSTAEIPVQEGTESTILNIKSEIQASDISRSVTSFTEFPESAEFIPRTHITIVDVANFVVKEKDNTGIRVIEGGSGGSRSRIVRVLNSGGKLQCNSCVESFHRVSDLNKHEKIHLPPQSYVCDFPLCGKEFTAAKYLSGHKDVHNPESRYKCDICNKKFRQPHGLTIHMRIHTLERPYKCEHCQEGFADLRRKNLHVLRKHIKEKPFKCEFCDKRCFLKSQMVLHVRRHTGEKPLRCTFCNKCFSRPNCLKRHEDIHLRAPGSTLPPRKKRKSTKNVKSDPNSSTFNSTETASTLISTEGSTFNESPECTLTCIDVTDSTSTNTGNSGELLSS